MTITVSPPQPDDLAAILDDPDGFWDGRDLQHLHHPMFVREFGATGLLARDDGRPVGYLFGFLAPAGHGYIHLIAVHRRARGTGIARLLYDRFAAEMAGRGATALRAITTPANTASVAFHRRLGFGAERVADYAGPGADRVVLRRPMGAAAHIGPARGAEAGELLTVQRAAFLAEVLHYGGRPIPPAVEDLPQVRAAIDAGGVLVAREAGRLVGTVRVCRQGHDAQISRLAVVPDQQGHGLGARLVRAAEESAGDVGRFVLSTGSDSDATLRLYQRLGYVETHRGHDTAGVAIRHLARDAT